MWRVARNWHPWADMPRTPSNNPSDIDMTAKKNLRIGIIGAVHDHFWPVWGKGVFHEFRTQPGVTLVAATEQHPELQARLKADLGIEHIYTDYNEMLEKEQLDAVLIGLPSNAKVAPVRAAAKRGVHILMDKPLCTTMADAWEMKRIVDETGVKLVVNSLSIWKAPLRKGFELINEGAIGKPYWAKWRNVMRAPRSHLECHGISPTGYGTWRRTEAAFLSTIATTASPTCATCLVARLACQPWRDTLSKSTYQQRWKTTLWSP